MSLPHSNKGRIPAALVLILLLTRATAFAQWQKVLRIDTAGFVSVHFLNYVGAPNVGLIGGTYEHWPQYGMAVYRSSDYGRSWVEYDLRAREDGWLVDFSFKDSLTGWLATKAGGTSPFSGIYKTTDGGKTWGDRPVLQGEMNSICYSRTNGGLFATGLGSLLHDSLNFGSSDEGSTWRELPPRSNRPPGTFAFIDSLHGIQTGSDDEIPKPGAYWYLSSDAGWTWTKLDIDSTSWEPVPIVGTSTWFAITRFGSVIRTDDNWRTWSTLYWFSQQTEHAPRWPHEHPCSSWMGGDGNILFVQFTGGAYASCDSGLTWTALHSPSSISVEFTRAYWDGRNLYLPIADTTRGAGVAELWKLDLSNSVSSSWADTGFERHFGLGQNARVRCSLSNARTDSAIIEVMYDPKIFEFQTANLPAGWSYRVAGAPGDIEVALQCNHSHQDTIFHLGFSTSLMAPESRITVKPLAVYVDSLYLPCLAELPQRTDTLIAYFDGCGNDLLWHFMQTGSIFELLRIEPNPASQSVTVVLERRDAGQVAISVSDVLGNERLTATTSEARETLDVSKLPSGTYFLRASEAGTVRTRRFVVDR